MSDAEKIEHLEAEIDMLREKVNDLSRAYNHHNRFLSAFRDAYAELFAEKWYRIFLWIRPFSLPIYENKWTSRLLENPPRLVEDWQTPRPINLAELDDDETA
jgi:hypothetical protein